MDRDMEVHSGANGPQKPLGRSGDARYSAGVWYIPYKVRGVIPWRIWVETRVLVPGDIFSWDFFI